MTLVSDDLGIIWTELDATSCSVNVTCSSAKFIIVNLYASNAL